jgi:hypothetical protein
LLWQEVSRFSGIESHSQARYCLSQSCWIVSDGQLARLLDRTSPEGSALDHAFDDIKTLSLSIALAFGI